MPNKMFINLLIFLLSAIGLIPSIGFTATYWVSPNGTATWANCRSETPLDGTAACSLNTANSNVSPGDTVYLRGGTYNTHIFPARSGDASNRITYTAYSGETPIIRNTTTPYATYYHGIALTGRNYIKIIGVTVDNPINEVPLGKSRPLMITHGGSYNEIANCIIDGNGGGTIQIWKGNSDLGPEYAAKFNWIHDNYIIRTGSVSTNCDDDGGMQIGVPAYDNVSGYNTIENNVFYAGGHHNLETYTKYNVIRNNIFHHENGSFTAPNPPCPYRGGGPNGDQYGNRNIQIYDGYNEDKFNLIEGNKFGHSGQPPDDDGGDGFTLTAPKNIVRYNAIYNSQNNGILMKTGASSYADYNRIYNNTIYYSGSWYSGSGQWQGANFRWYGSYARVGNVIKNNILYSYGPGGKDWTGGSATIYTDNTVINNFCTDPQPGRCSANGNPLLVNPDISDPTSLTLPDLRLQSNSPAIDGGTHLTLAKGSGNNSTTLVVDDALYFQDGTWGSSLSNIQADWIAIGSVDNVVQIKSINYSTNTITLKSPMSWSDRAKIWLYKKSDGERVLYGSAPDFGAYEFIPTIDKQSPIPPKNLRIQ